MYQRHGILTNIMAVVLVFTMPLCCCIVKTATGADSSCCAVEIVETESCCQQQQKTCGIEQSSEQGHEQAPCDGDCGCTIKGTFITPEWTPPVDVIGFETPTPFFAYADYILSDQYVAHAIHGPPKFESYRLGFSGAPPMRGALILQV
jgi:hypothetical protein